MAKMLVKTIGFWLFPLSDNWRPFPFNAMLIRSKLRIRMPLRLLGENALARTVSLAYRASYNSSVHRGAVHFRCCRLVFHDVGHEL
jgi:hypothetical protein